MLFVFVDGGGDGLVVVNVVIFWRGDGVLVVASLTLSNRSGRVGYPKSRKVSTEAD